MPTDNLKELQAVKENCLYDPVAKGEAKMEHYITKIHIKQLRHLQNIDIELGQDKRTHLILTGKNG